MRSRPNIFIWFAILANYGYSQSFPQGKFYEANTIGCNYNINFVADSTFLEYQECDVGPSIGKGIYYYMYTDNLLILNFKKHPDNINVGKLNILVANKTDSDSIVLKYKVMSIEDSANLVGAHIKIKEKVESYYIPFSNEYNNLVIFKKDSIVRFTAGYAGYYDFAF